MVMGFRAKGWGSTIPRATERHMRRAWDGDGILDCVVVVKGRFDVCGLLKSGVVRQYGCVLSRVDQVYAFCL